MRRTVQSNKLQLKIVARPIIKFWWPLQFSKHLQKVIYIIFPWKMFYFSKFIYHNNFITIIMLSYNFIHVWALPSFPSEERLGKPKVYLMSCCIKLYQKWNENLLLLSVGWINPFTLCSSSDYILPTTLGSDWIKEDMGDGVYKVASSDSDKTCKNLDFYSG